MTAISPPPESRASLQADVAAVARLVAPMWPLTTFVAVNPLLGLLELGFGPAISEARRWLPVAGLPPAELWQAAFAQGRITEFDLAEADAELGADGIDPVPADPVRGPLGPRTAAERADLMLGTDVARRIDADVARWCAAFVDEGTASWAIPGREEGFYRAWTRLAPVDPGLRRLVGSAARRRLRLLPEDPETAIQEALDALGIPPEHRRDEMRGHVASLPGWFGYARWRDEWAPPGTAAPPLRVVDLLAVRLTYEAAALGGRRLSTPTEPDGLSWQQAPEVWLSAYEGNYRERLLTQLHGRRPSSVDQPAAQVVCCIDVRSEALRRHLEGTGPYETFGFAGFFGVAMRWQALDSPETSPRCPVLLSPAVVVEEAPAPGAGRQVTRWNRRRRWSSGSHGAWHSAKQGAGSAFPLAEAAGWVMGPLAAARTCVPRRFGKRAVRPRTEIGVTAGEGRGFTLEEQVLIAQTMLTAIGLTDGFAPLVVLCGHSGESVANPHASSLDCGACGGNPGGPSARAAATVLNRLEVRHRLGELGIAIPATTWFLAAEHNTTTDSVTFLDVEAAPPGHHAHIEQLRRDLAAAGHRLAAERSARLPGAGTGAKTGSQRAADWAENRPEWGLAGNAAFVIGPRSLTRGLDLGGRVFLHSYETGSDPEGTILESIMTGPLVVAHWINAQYYFSTNDPGVYGAGDKTLHNPVGGVGVVVGWGGDLRVGLPQQSVMVGDRPYHEPMRLLTVVTASTVLMEAVIARNELLGKLFDGGWVHLVVHDPDQRRWWRRLPGGRFTPWVPRSSPTPGPEDDRCATTT